jgi:phosphoribosylaminoimidazole-succinocarboxamide synthase
MYQSNITSLKLLARGKVRDIYEINDELMLIVTTDRLSAFDVILPECVPGKGEMLTSISTFWFGMLRHIIPNHLVDIDLTSYHNLLTMDEIRQIRGRAVVVKRLSPLPIEAIVRGYLIGSGWKEYLKSGNICGVELPENLQLAEKLPTPIYTPTTKAAVGDHDENITFEDTERLIGSELANTVREVSIQLYTQAAEYAAQRGIIIADTKFEFGLDADNNLILIDEILTPDSSRFWDANEYVVGTNPPSFDKQYVRDYLETIEWDKQPPGPTIPHDVLMACSQKYKQAINILKK